MAVSSYNASIAPLVIQHFCLLLKSCPYLANSCIDDYSECIKPIFSNSPSNKMQSIIIAKLKTLPELSVEKKLISLVGSCKFAKKLLTRFVIAIGKMLILSKLM